MCDDIVYNVKSSIYFRFSYDRLQIELFQFDLECLHLELTFCITL